MHAEPDEPGLRAVVQVALDPAQRRGRLVDGLGAGLLQGADALVGGAGAERGERSSETVRYGGHAYEPVGGEQPGAARPATGSSQRGQVSNWTPRTCSDTRRTEPSAVVDGEVVPLLEQRVQGEQHPVDIRAIAALAVTNTAVNGVASAQPTARQPARSPSTARRQPNAPCAVRRSAGWMSKPNSRARQGSLGRPEGERAPHGQGEQPRARAW